MTKKFLITFCLTTLLSVFMSTAQAQNYGPNITLEQAKVVLAAAEAEAVKQGWPMAIAVVDTAGNLVAYVKRDNTQIASVKISQAKAYTAIAMKRPTKALQDTLAKGAENLRLLSFDGVALAEGGIPLVANGVFIGAIGVSGMASDQDGMVAAAGAAAIK
ncbi:MAG TPA: heme-binding protein [Candidatus Acidoferrum sp.]|nr:heme-binding protein [Candidatus Acidoferrum sp.]